ncbi:MAG: TerB family tellurite resistance protein [Rhodospirillales bacterium]|nr:TerB family tellurite resistance protein [Rhodospirillales bacterium]
MALDIPADSLPGVTAGTPGAAADALTAAMAFPPVVQHASEYWIDSVQRMILFWDTIRERGNIFNEHRAKGAPPVLDFAYDVILDGRSLPRPCNYMLLQIRPKPGMTVDAKKRPFVIVDPRAGHGAGVGGMKEDSQVGVSLRAGHPTYFVAFTPMPVPGQTLADIAAAEAKFIETVRLRHPEADGKPAVIGNCQAGWAVMSLSAVEPGLMGPVIICGSPMSYWAGADGKNPMRYMGGLIGGAWITSLMSDLGGGIFDGANLVANFERLNPANTLWAKNYNLYASIDTEAERFLEFERWWTGFFLMTKPEMTRIVNELFVGNKLAAGRIRTESGAYIDLKDIAAPIVVFASGGDNITPPQQALNWIVDVYGSEEEIKIHGQTIVYVLHRDIGHLGIFVSGKVAKKEHYEINEAIDFIDVLPPGLYEMVVEKMPADAADRPEDLYLTRFEARTINDIRRLDDQQKDVEYFPSSKLVSEINAKFYDVFVGPWVKMMVTEPVADVLRELHPLRIQHRMLSDKNPFVMPLKGLAAAVREARQPASPDNMFVACERQVSEAIIGILDHYRDVRDRMQEQTFKAIYGPKALGAFFYTEDDVEAAKFAPIVRTKREQAELDATIERLKSRIERGGFVEGWARIVAALMLGSGGINERELEAGRQVREQDPRLSGLSVAERKRLLKEQAHMLQVDEDRALRALPKLLTSSEERRQAWTIAKQIALGDGVVDDRQRVTLDRISKALALDAAAAAE